MTLQVDSWHLSWPPRRKAAMHTFSFCMWRPTRHLVHISQAIFSASWFGEHTITLTEAHQSCSQLLVLPQRLAIWAWSCLLDFPLLNFLLQTSQIAFGIQLSLVCQVDVIPYCLIWGIELAICLRGSCWPRNNSYLRKWTKWFCTSGTLRIPCPTNSSIFPVSLRSILWWSLWAWNKSQMTFSLQQAKRKIKIIIRLPHAV